MILAEQTPRGWRFLVVWTNRPSVYYSTLLEAETAFQRTNLS